MKKIICSLVVALFAFDAMAAAQFQSCGAGYILTQRSKIDGIDAAECEKLWCRDLENGKTMGDGTRVTSGYRDTATPVLLCDAENNCVECFGDRKWCTGEVAGIWNPEYGAYTRSGADSAAYVARQKGGCFAWQLEEPECPAGESAVLSGGDWICVTGAQASSVSRESAVRRTGTFRRMTR